MTEIDPSLETGVANTLVPYFDINFYNFYDLFLKEPEELSISKEVQPHESLAIDCSELKPVHSSPKSVQTPATPIKEVIKTVATSLKQNYELLAESHQGMKAKSEMVIGNKDETRKDKAMIPDNLIDNELASNSLSPNNQSPTQGLDSPPQIPDNRLENQKNKDDFPDVHILRKEKSEMTTGSKTIGPYEVRNSGSFEEIPRRNSNRKSVTTYEDYRKSKEFLKESNRPKVNLPKMLVRIPSKEDFGEDHEVQEIDAISNVDKKSFVSSLRPPPSVRSGLHITVGSLALLFAMSKNLQKKVKFSTIQPFDQNLPLIKKIYGLPEVKDSVLEFKTQSLSKLGNC